jgi:uncharacterized protein
MLLALIVLTGCARSPAITLHGLLPPAAGRVDATRAAEAEPLRVVILSTTVPQSIDRPQLIVRRADALVVVDDQRWVEPLKRAIPRTLAHYLSAELDPAMVWSSSSAAPSRSHARITLDVARWESAPGQSAIVEMLWTIRSGSRERSGRSYVESPVPGAGYGELVAAHRDNLRVVSRDLAAGLRSLLSQPQGDAAPSQH